MEKKLLGGKGKYKCKLPLICFKCNKVVHISSRCPGMNMNDKNEKGQHIPNK